jgi:hypothetical protein
MSGGGPVPDLVGMPRRAIALLVGVLALAGSQAALGGTGSPASATGSSAWRVAVVGASGGPVYPGRGGEAFTFTLASRSGAIERPAGLAVSVSTDAANGDALTPSGAVIGGCLARWFRVMPAIRLNHLGATYRGRFTLSMVDAPVNQDACAGHRVGVVVSVA